MLLLAACTETPPAALASPSPTVSFDSKSSPSPSQSAEPSPSPLPAFSPTPLPIGTPVARQVLPPATVLPVARLCTTKTIATANGNVQPVLCRGGAVNVQAWKFYATAIAPSVLAAGPAARLPDVELAACRDGARFRDTMPELDWAFVIASAYYGWTFAFDPREMTCP